MEKKKKLTSQEFDSLIEKLKNRFDKINYIQSKVSWQTIETILSKQDKKCRALFQMEKTGGEPNLIKMNNETNQYTFCDCSQESPLARRSCCYDQEALDKRKNNKPLFNAIEFAKEIGAQLLDESQYRFLQTLAPFDLKTSSWILTPDDIRKLGGALFCERRYQHVFTFHNGAESYYSSRGFRCIIEI
ncbi:MAG: DUF4256 domain-containing protein [Chitinophagaceae bacterium]|nr:DUF4256 domain-containing protein [Chitinophagaceae bacterium]